MDTLHNNINSVTAEARRSRVFLEIEKILNSGNPLTKNDIQQLGLLIKELK